MRLLRLTLVVVFVFSLAVVGTACTSDDPGTEETTTETPSDTTEPETEGESADTEPDAEDDPARLVVESKCSLCHTLDRVWSADYDRGVWEATVDRMKANGLVITDDEYETVVDYLSNQ